MPSKSNSKNQNKTGPEIGSGTPKEMPADMPLDDAYLLNQNRLALERTEFAKIRTDLALTSGRLSADRTHLSYLRTIVSLIGSSATLYEALPYLGVSRTFSTTLAAFLLLAAIYFIYKDATIYTRMKRQLRSMEEHASLLAKETEDHIYKMEETAETLESLETLNSLESLDS